MTSRRVSPHRHAILLVGLHSSGKSTLSQALASTGPFWIFELGDGVREEARRRRETNLVRVASDILTGSDPIRLAKIARKRANALPDRIPVFVGARTSAEKEFISAAYPSLLVVGLSTSDAIRRDRWRSRQMMSTDKWIERERWEARWKTRALVQAADLCLNGTESIPVMCKKITAAIHRKWKVKHV